MAARAIVLSIYRRHARDIFERNKTVELRRLMPKVTKGDLVLVYVPSPTKALVGAFSVDKIITGNPGMLWKQVMEKSGLNKREYDEYFKNSSKAVGIFVGQTWKLKQPIKLKELREHLSDFIAPQSYRYAKVDEISLVRRHSESGHSRKR